jgi:hypothetical protein
LFWTLGANQVGKGAIAGWRDILVPAIRTVGSSVKLWPFDGHLRALLRKGNMVVVETYPAEYYGSMFSTLLKGKGKGENRKAVAGDLLGCAKAVGVKPTADLARVIEEGFMDGDDAFDAVVGLLAIIAVLLGKRKSGEPSSKPIRSIEGWILGQDPFRNAND